MFKNQDDQLDEISGIVKVLKYDNQDFNQEVTYQNKLLGKLDVDIQRTHEKMVNVDNRLKRLIAKSKTCMLWVFLIIEIVALILVLTLM